MEKQFEKDPRLTYIDTDPQTGVRVYLYRPTLLRPLYTDLEPMRLKRRMRFLLEYLYKGHYSVYYAELDGKLIGYNVIAPGGRRLTCTTEKDAVTGPSYILPEYRNHGYNKAMKRIVFPHCGFKKIYCWVLKRNKPSAASLTRFGFVPCGEVKQKKGLLRKQVPAENGEAVVFRYDQTAQRPATKEND